jgi:hypothetical protein
MTALHKQRLDVIGTLEQNLPIRAWILRFGGLFNKRRKDRELEDEIESHLQMHIEDNLRLGMTPEEARSEAMIKLGGFESTKEFYRDQRSLPFLETFVQDVRYGVITAYGCCAKNPGFTAGAVLDSGCASFSSRLIRDACPAGSDERQSKAQSQSLQFRPGFPPPPGQPHR